MLTLEQLQQFLVVAKLKSFTKAAAELFVSHSTISRNISALEQELGVSLLIRDTRSVSLTYAGQVMYEKGTQLLKQMESMEWDVQKAGRGMTGVLNIACVSLYEERLFAAFQSFRKEYPEIGLHLHNYDPMEVVQEVLYDRADLGVIYSYALSGVREPLNIIHVTSGKFCIVAPTAFQAEKMKKYGTPEFEDIKILTLNGLFYDFLGDMTSEVVTEGAPSIEEYQTTTLESLLLQIKSGAGVALLPEHVAKNCGEGCQIVELDQVKSTYDVVLFSRKSDQNPTLPLFTEWYEKTQ